MFNVTTIKKVFVLVSIFASFSAAKAQVISERDLAQQEKFTFFNLLKNISSSTEAVGSVSQFRVATPLSQNVHSVRDAALATQELIKMYVRYPVGNEKANIKQMLIDQVEFIQKSMNSAFPTQLGLGHAYFALDGSLSKLVQPRVQSEANALRAIAMIKIYNLARLERWPEFQALRQALFDNQIGSSGLLKLELDFIVRVWAQPSFDLWSQANGRHFANLILLKKALVGGAQIASANGDLLSSRNYLSEAAKIQRELETFWDASKQSLRSSKANLSSPVGRSFLWDSSVLFGILEGQAGDQKWNLSDDRVISTVDQMQEMFRRAYPINQNNSLAPAIGKYPEDNQGHALVQMSSLMARYYYELNSEITERKQIKVTVLNLSFYNRLSTGSNFAIKPGVLILPTSPLYKFLQQALLNEGDRYLARILSFRTPDASLSEQFSRLTSLMQGPQNSTAASAAFLSAKSSRDSLLLN